MKNFSTLAMLAVALVLVSGSAFAGIPVERVPEPMSLSLLAGGIAAIAAVKRVRRK